MLAATYGSQLQFPQFFEGSFTQALQAARHDLKLLVVYLHSPAAQHSEAFCTNVLSNEALRSMLDGGFLVWAGDASGTEGRSVTRVVRAREYPSFSVILPASADDVRVIGSVGGNIEVDGAVALLTACLDEMEMHRAEIVARTEQHAEDRQLRQQQDREYQEALEMDRKRAEEQALQEQQQREAERLEEARQQKEREEAERLEAERRSREEVLRQRAAALAPEGPADTARISLRLPAGQRVQRRFAPGAPLADVYRWAEVVPYMPEHAGKGLEVPERFTLKTSFPSRELIEMERTVEELQLAGSNILLAAIEDDD